MFKNSNSGLFTGILTLQLASILSSTPSLGSEGSWQLVRNGLSSECRQVPMFARTTESGLDYSTIRYVSKDISLNQDDPYTLFAYTDGQSDFVFLSLHLKVKTNDQAIHCAKSSFGQNTNVARMAPTGIHLQFFSPLDDFSTSVEGTEAFDIFTESQWVHTMVSGPDMFSMIRAEQRFLDTVFSGTAVWSLDDGRTIRQPFRLSAADEDQIIDAILDSTKF